MRHADSYGIVDRRLLFDRYLHRMSLKGMAIYLFLVIAADRDGRSYYSDRTIGGILRLSLSDIAAGRAELISVGLVEYRAPNLWVKSLSQATGGSSSVGSWPSRHSGRRALLDPVPIRGVVPEALKAIIRSLEERT